MTLIQSISGRASEVTTEGGIEMRLLLLLLLLLVYMALVVFAPSFVSDWVPTKIDRQTHCFLCIDVVDADANGTDEDDIVVAL